MIEVGVTVENCWDRLLDKPVWIINNYGDLGVLANGRPYFLYKGNAMQYSGPVDGNTPMRYRRVKKREFGETCKPFQCVANNIDFVFDPEDEDMEEWYDMPVANAVNHKADCPLACIPSPQKFMFDVYADGNLSEVNMKFCPECGAKLIPVAERE